jgi:hypothetical protein
MVRNEALDCAVDSDLHTHLHDPEVPEQRRQSFLEKDFAFCHCKYLVTKIQLRIVQGEKILTYCFPRTPPCQLTEESMPSTNDAI